MQGELSEHEKMVAALKQVDVVISTLAVPQILEQFKLLMPLNKLATSRFVAYMHSSTTPFFSFSLIF